MWPHMLGFVLYFVFQKWYYTDVYSIVEPFLSMYSLIFYIQIHVHVVYGYPCIWERTTCPTIFWSLLKNLIRKITSTSTWGYRIGLKKTTPWGTSGIPRMLYIVCFPHVPGSKGHQRPHTAAAGNWVSLPNTACPAAGRLTQRVQARGNPWRSLCCINGWIQKCGGYYDILYPKNWHTVVLW